MGMTQTKYIVEGLEPEIRARIDAYFVAHDGTRIDALHQELRADGIIITKGALWGYLQRWRSKAQEQRLLDAMARARVALGR
jgi:hypothetical protein